MNHLSEDARRFASGLELADGVEVVICPASVLLPVLASALGAASPVRLGAQNLHFEPSGAFTGEHGPAMIADAGCRYVICGHSERRTLFGESDEAVQRKVAAALGSKLRPILCVGEKLAEREQGATFRVLRAQLLADLADLGSPAPDPRELVVAYEPIWAIGTGRTASAAQAQQAMAFCREQLAERFGWAWAERARLLYGGSVTPDNAAGLIAQEDVDGFLVGGASLDARRFSEIVAAAAPGRGGA
ncbi:MAG: triose-phosphate isomerase [Deltaproteobacteria bacterium]|nr:triose-phosphate isomerase [Deltaproteobacteria bacterium]